MEKVLRDDIEKCSQIIEIPIILSNTALAVHINLSPTLSPHRCVGPVEDDEVEAHGDERHPEEQVQRARGHKQRPASGGGRRRLDRRQRDRRSLEDPDGGEGGEAEVEAVRR